MQPYNFDEIFKAEAYFRKYLKRKFPRYGSRQECLDKLLSINGLPKQPITDQLYRWFSLTKVFFGVSGEGNQSISRNTTT